MSAVNTSADAGFTFRHWQRDLPASLVVFLVAMPLCMGVALASGAPVSTGLITGIVGGLVVGFLAGSPLQVSGPAAGLTVVVYQLIQTLGIEKLGVCVLAAGALQLVAGYFKLGQWFRAVSPAVIQGMLAGIGILIFASQFHVMVDDKPHHSGIENLVTIPQAVMKSLPPAALGNAEERAAATAELKQLGAIHLKQAELQEEVHHLLSGVAPDHLIQPAAAAAPEPTQAERDLSERLTQLAARQQAIIASLAEVPRTKMTEQDEAAKAIAVAALADLESGDIYAARASQDKAESALKDLLGSRKNHGWAALLGLLTIAGIIGWKLLAVGRLKLVPGPLVAIVITTVVAMLVQMPVLYVEIPNSLADEIYFPTFAEISSLLTWGVWVFVLQLAIIASAETLLCASAVDRLHTGPRTDYDRELKAQGVGNMLCGLMCALPMTGVIVRSSANLQAGARTRLSAILHGLWLLLFVVAFAWLLRSIPTCALAGILVYTGFKLVDIKAAKALAKRGQGEIAIYVATVVTIVATDLLIGVLVGIALSIVKLLYVFSHLEIEHTGETSPGKYEIRLTGSATFLKIPALAQALERVPQDAELHINVARLDYIDAACLDLLDSWEAQNEPHGARLVIDAESLHARFWRRQTNGLIQHNPESLTLGSNGNGHVAVSSTHPHHKQRPI